MAQLKVIILFFCIVASSSAWKLTILHFNDIESQLEASKEDSDPPIFPPQVGGIARLVTALVEEEAAVDEAAGGKSIRLATANLVGGQNGWLSVLGWKEFGKLLDSVYKPDIMGLGLREFESDLPRTMDYLNASSAELPKVLVSNLNKTSCSKGATEGRFCNEFVLDNFIFPGHGGETIGFIGFVNPTAERLSDPGKLTFLDIPDALNDALKHDTLKNVKSVIAIGSGSLSIAKEIIDKVSDPKLKAVIFGGIAHDMTETYPLEYKGKFIATAHKYGRSFGRLVLDISNGVATVNKSSSSLINIKSQSPDGLTNQVLLSLAEKVVDENHNVTTTLVKLEASRDVCWRSECNLGNMVTDAMVHCAVNMEKGDLDNLAGVVAVWHSGSFFDDTVLPKHEISTLDIHKWLPYHNNAYLVWVNGNTLKKMFEFSGGAIGAPGNGKKDWGQFLQVSNGLEVKYSKSGGLISLRTMHLNDNKPVLEDVKDDRAYYVVIPSILYKGKSVYDFLPNGIHFVGSLGFDDQCVINYLSSMGKLKIGFEERIFIGDEYEPCPDPAPADKCSGSNTALTVILTLVITAIVVGIVIVGWKVVWPRFQQRTRSFP